uniref:Ig-like domain-containing protein n=1 Tax=Otus sunia TaxID=257818 RepID=A0A8C8AU93_9STRI
CESFPLLILSPLYLLGLESHHLPPGGRHQPEPSGCCCSCSWPWLQPGLVGSPRHHAKGQWQETSRIRYTSSKKGTNVCTFSIEDINSNDEGTYYCAYWEDHRTSRPQVFGSGTKLIVSGKLHVIFHTISYRSSEILQKKHENQIMYVCLIEKFYPEVIRVTWTDGADKEVTDNIVKGDVWKPTNGDKYSIGSWLTVPAENKDKNYYCKYEHESGPHSLSTQGIYYMLKM